MTVTEAPNVVGAVETSDRVAKFLHPVGSLALADHPVPSGKEEEWRFTPLRRLRGLHADAPFQPSATECTWTTPQGATVRPVSDPAELAGIRGASGYVPTDRTSARIFTEVESVLLVDVPADTELTEPVVIDLTGSDASVVEAGHIVLRFGAHSKADVVINHNGSATIAQVVETVAGDGAQITVTSLQEWADDTVHLAHHHVALGRDASVKHAVLTFGGDTVRISTSTRYNGPGGSAQLLGLYFADAGQHLEHRIFIDHDTPNCKSDALYKGALQGKSARTVWIGDVLIRKAAAGTNTYEMNRNLLLTPGARADSVPNLEIETGEIAGAGHASATGRFDDEQLFYLLSRGIPSDIARRLVVRGFFQEVLLKLGVPSAVERASETIERELAVTEH
ncbi:Fe-S cluster assembly protein SufD [Nakamurella sp. A5-74]|uniref:Fe-S cluster assembly protein SufD n=1 Tax=Nakamurella sp. A5-74 TaxID=3158264 RepID=A0AAU8DIV7_9ACTN